MKKILKSLLVLAIILAACIILNPLKAQAASTSDLTFALNSGGKNYSVSDCKESATGALTIPSTYNGKPFTTIGGYAFYACTKLTNVYYTGTQAQWDAISVGSNNGYFLNATLHLFDPCANGHTEEVIPGKAAICTEAGLAEINKQELKEGGNYIIHLYYNAGTSEKRTLALAVYLNERSVLAVNANGKINVSYTDPEIGNARAYIYNVGDAEIADIYDEAALKAITTPTQIWGKSTINKKTLDSGTYVIHFYYNIGTSAKKTVALMVTI